MAPPSISLLVARDDHVGVIRIVGRGSFSSSVSFRSALQDLRDRCRERIVLDLTQCSTMDSTFLGVLAQAALKHSELKQSCPQPTLEIFQANDRVTELLECMGVSHLLPLAPSCPLAEAAFVETSTTTAPASKQELTQTSLEAHQTLMTLHPDNVAKFKDVAQFLSEEMKRNSQKGS